MEGQLFTFGNGEYGPAGHWRDTKGARADASRGVGGEKVVGVAAGSRHTAVCTDAGELFAFGWGCKGRRACAEAG